MAGHVASPTSLSRPRDAASEICSRAAFEKRIDGVVAWDTCFDMRAAAAPILKLAADPKGAKVPDVVWAANNGLWTMGTSSIADTAVAMAGYTLAPVADRITQPVLIMQRHRDGIAQLKSWRVRERFASSEPSSTHRCNRSRTSAVTVPLAEARSPSNR
jgi:hypothetical protein